MARPVLTSPLQIAPASIMTSYAESLSVCLRAAGASDELLQPDFLECLTTMPFGSTYLEFASGEAGAFVPWGSTVDPHGGIDLALKAIGWTAFQWHAPAEAPLDEAAGEALAIAKEAIARFGLVMAGPVSSSGIDRSAGFGGESFAIRTIQNDHVVLAGSTGQMDDVRLGIGVFMERWRADTVAYKRGAFTLRARFERRESLIKATVLARTIPLIRAKLLTGGGGSRLYGSDGPLVFCDAEAVLRLGDDFARGTLTAAGKQHLKDAIFPLAQKQRGRGAAFFAEAIKPKASANYARQARLYGALAQATGPDDDDSHTVAELIAELADLDGALLSDLR